MMSQEQFAEFAFSERDALFVADRPQVDFLRTHPNPHVHKLLLFPLSFDAFGAVLRWGHRKLAPHLDYVDFRLCQQKYTQAEPQARQWLRELGLGFEYEGVDVVDFDAPSQFLLFTLVSYIERTAERIVRSHPAIETFYILKSAESLPLDYYFDSDVPAAVLQFVCEREGRRVCAIHMAERPWKFPHYASRPMLDARPSPDLACLPLNVSLTNARYRVGFAQTFVPFQQEIVDELRDLKCQTVMFSSSWGVPITTPGDEDDHFVDLSSVAGPNNAQLPARLAELWNNLKANRQHSSLDSALIQNPHLDFQLEYIITQRWKAQAALLARAAQVVEKVPLDLFIHCELCQDEGALLAKLYRNAGARMLGVPHSRWPCDPNWSSWQPGDHALVYSRSAAERLEAVSPASETFVVSAPSKGEYRSLLRPRAQDLTDTRREIAGGRRVVMLVTNALELLGVPFVSPLDHVASFSIFGNVPDEIAPKVLVALRTKPGGFTEDPLIYAGRSALTEESVSFFDGLSFTECLQLADCVVGFNTATTGYYEALERGVPLIHVQLADVSTMHPNLPEEAVPRIRKSENVWPAIASVLFDPLRRADLLERQRRFFVSDSTPNLEGEVNPLQSVLHRLLTPLPFRHRQQSAIDEAPEKANAEPDLDFIRARLAEGRGSGYVDDALAASDGKALVIGWAADLSCGVPAKSVHVFVNGTWAARTVPRAERPDVAQAYGNDRLKTSGFAAGFTLVPGNESALSAYGECHDGKFYEIVRDLRLPLQTP